MGLKVFDCFILCLLSVTILGATTSASVTADLATCTETLTVSSGSGIPYVSLPLTLPASPWEIFDDYDPNDIYVGFYSAHAYFATSEGRYDGAFGVIVRPTKYKAVPRLHPGIVIRIRNIPTHLLSSLNRNLNSKSGPLSMICSQGAYSFLNSEGIKICSSSPKSFLPSALLQDLLTNGVRLKNGEFRHPEVFVLGSGSLDLWMDIVKRSEWEIPKEIVLRARWLLGD